MIKKVRDEQKRITIKDVARLSGVSKGTVDRVLHNRGDVSPGSRKKVLEVIERIGYRPNINASLLASKRHYRVICLIPSFKPGEYWEMVYAGIKQAEDKARNYNIGTEVVFYGQFDRESFREACRELLDRKPDAVMLAPIYHDETIKLTSELAGRGVPFVYIDSRLEDTGYLAYYGIPMYRSGYLAGSLLFETEGIGKIANFRIERGAMPRDNPTLNRWKGFMDYLEEHNPDCEVCEQFIRPYDAGHNMKVMDGFFENHLDIRHIVTFNSRVHLISEYLENRNMQNKIVVGFDKLPANIAGLEKGYIKYLITQRTETQVYRGMNAIIDYLVSHGNPSVQDNFMSIDILNRYNVDYYFDFYEY